MWFVLGALSHCSNITSNTSTFSYRNELYVILASDEVYNYETVNGVVTPTIGYEEVHLIFICFPLSAMSCSSRDFSRLQCFVLVSRQTRRVTKVNRGGQLQIVGYEGYFWHK